MTGFIFKIMVLLIGIINTGWALPWFEYKTDYLNLKSNYQDERQSNNINFSGVWSGECDGNPAVDLTIKQDANQFSISYGFMDEKYTIGEVKSSNSSHLDASENVNTTVNWNTENTALIFINYNLFINQTGILNVFFSKVSMELKDNQLIVNGKHYHTNGSLDDFDHETISCRYHHK